MLITPKELPDYQPLRIPAGWSVTTNNFFDVEPTRELVEDIFGYFIEDMLRLECTHKNCGIDLGWYPEDEFDEGEFKVVAYENDFDVVYKFPSRDKQVIVSEVERLCVDFDKLTRE